ncbi:MAG TPA: hypothetical protein VNG35_07045 [Gemmatimonadales bacterium]|nr:hypothetical protein [Gemmatimonadales bacterium]
MRTHAVMVLMVSAALVFVSPGMAQGPATSLQAGATPFEGESIFELGARFSPRGAFGADVSIDLYPEYFAADVLAGVVDFSLAANLRLGPVVTIEPRLGASILGAAGSGGAVAAPGWNSGLGLVVTIDSRTALRADYTYRQLKVGDEMYPVPSLTAGFVIHH